MTNSDQRYLVSNIGYAFAVHDTQVPQEYAHPAGREKDHKSSNVMNSRIIEIVPTRAQAQAIADRLNREAG